MDIPMNRFPQLAPHLQAGVLPRKPDENVWVETKAADGKSYYYHAKTRETSWNKPEGATIITQEQLAAQTASMRMPGPGLGPPGLLGQRPMMPGTMPSSGLLPGFNPAFAVGGRFPGLPIPQQQQQQPWVPHQVPQLLGNVQDGKPTIDLIDPEIKKRASEWIEYKTPEGKPYYFNTMSKQTIWEKPQPLLDLDEALEKAKSQVMERNRTNQVQPSFEINRQEVSAEVITLDSATSNGHQNGPSSVQAKIESKVAEAQQQPKDKSKPVSSTPIDKTPWCVVWTGDGKVFFYNPSTKTSVWERPIELVNRPEVDQLLKGPPKEEEVTEKQFVKESVEKRSAEMEELGPSKKLKKVEEAKKEVAPTAEVLAARKREEIPLEDRIAEFKGMLAEKKVSAFSTWEKELHKIVFDERYLLLTSKERKMVFDDYVRDRAEEERNEKRLKYKMHRDQFHKLLEEANITTRSTFSDFCRKFSKDERFVNIEKMREKEAAFNDYIADLRRKEKEDRILQRDKLKTDFIELLNEKSESLKNLARKFKWSEAREVLKSDPRYRAIESSTEKEDMVRSFVSQFVKSDIKEEGEAEEEDEEELKERERQERVEASLKQRKQEVEKEMSSHLKEREKEREQHKRLEAVETINALLSDLVKSPDMTWKEARKALSKDKRIESCGCLSRDEQEELFNQHLKTLCKKKQDKFHELLSEVKSLTLTSSWRDVRRQIKDDSRYHKFSSSDRKCEREFNKFMEYKLEEAKQELREFLLETKILTHKSKKLIDESDQHLQEIISVLQNDKRYLNLEHFEDERRDILMTYVKELEKNGPPPPPTASEPVRKKGSQSSSSHSHE